ncbi:MAG: hypothetical protein WC205_16790 [Opitutaceae bacterium]|jgi:hypothetical protein
MSDLALATFDSLRCRFVPSLSEQAVIGTLDDSIKAALKVWLVVMGRCHLARNKKAEYAAIETEMKGSGLRGFSEGNIKRRWLDFKASNWSWRVLVADYKLPPDLAETARTALPPAFVAYWQRYAVGFSGGARAAHVQLEARWQAGDTIEGLGSWMSWWQAQPQNDGRPLPVLVPPMPEGCSYDNLVRKLPQGVELTAAREGFFSATNELPIMRRDRSELRFLELVTWDDHPLNLEVARVDLGQVCKVNGLFGMDVATATIIQHGIGARTEMPNGVERSLNRSDTRGQLFQFLRRYGVPKNYVMWLLFERASSGLNQQDEEWLHHISNGMIRVKRTGMHTHSLTPGGPSETYGSPQAKGWIESYFNLLDRALSGLPGQKGSNPLTDQKGDFKALKDEAEKTLALVKDLPPALANLATLRVLTEEQCKVLVNHTIAVLDNRDNHRLQGFEPVPMWRVRGLTQSNPWRPLDEMPRDLPASAVEIESFMETPMQKRRRLYDPADFNPIDESVLVYLLDDKKPVTVTRPYQITFQDQRVTRTYTLQDPRLEKIGTPFTAIYDRNTRDSIHLHRPGGGYVGTALLWKGANPLNAEEIAATSATIKEQQNHLLKRAKTLQLPTAAAHNERIAADNERIAGVLSEQEAARLEAGAMRTATEAVATTRAASTKRTAKKRADADKTLTSITTQAATMTGL